MTDSGSSTGKRRDPRLWGAALLAAALLVTVVVWLVASSEDEDTETGTTPTETPSATMTTGRNGTPLPTKSPGQTVPTETATPVQVPKPVRAPLEAPADLRNGVTVEVTGVESVAGEGRGPGETSGPALRITIAVTNDSSAEVDLIASVATLYFGSDRSPASDLSGPGVVRMPETVAAGETVTGTYVFAVPRNQRDAIVVHFGYDAAEPVAIFSGSAS